MLQNIYPANIGVCINYMVPYYDQYVNKLEAVQCRMAHLFAMNMALLVSPIS